MKKPGHELHEYMGHETWQPGIMAWNTTDDLTRNEWKHTD